MRYTLTILCILVCQSFVFAQNCNNILLGEIIDFHDKTPLADALYK